jgi:hypothetical protein
MTSTLGRFALVAALLVLAASPARSTAAAGDGAAISRRGTYAGGRYMIEVPIGWNGGLVVYAHGYRGTEHSPLASHLAAKGYAWAASSFRTDGYRPDWFLEDTLQVRDLFIREVGRPRWTIIHGQAMGAHIAVASLELHTGVYQGALTECGAVDGVGIADYLFAYTAAAELIAGVPLLDAPDEQTFTRTLNERVVTALGMPGSYTARGRQFDSVVKYLAGGDGAGKDLPLRLRGLERHYLINMTHRNPDVEREPALLKRAGSTVHIRYRIDPGLGLGEEELNARVRRLHPARNARSLSANPVYAEPTGRLTAPLLTLHETGDVRVPLSLEQSYRRRTVVAGTDHLLVQRAIRAPSHCAIDSETRERAFDDLVAWIERGARPDGEDLLAPDLSRVGLKWTRVLYPEDPLFRRR